MFARTVDPIGIDITTGEMVRATSSDSITPGTGGGATTVAWTGITGIPAAVAAVGAGTYAGAASITTLGTIGTGIWQGSVIDSTYGGTGVNNAGRTLTISTNSGTILFSSSSLTLTVAAAASVSGTNTGDQTSVSGNAGTATKLASAVTIGGVSFDGSGNITVASATGGFTVSGGALALGSQSITMTGSIGATGARVTKGWFTDLQVTNAIVGSITGNAATVTGATFTTALTVNTGTLTLTANSANTSVLTIGAGAVSVSGTNTGDQTTVSGNAGSATVLQNARNINGVSFNGSGDITVTAAAGTLTGTTLNSTVVTSSLTSVGSLASLTMAGNLTLVAGTTTVHPLTFTSGTNLTTPSAGDMEFDGVNFYATLDTTSSRGAIPVEQYFHLASDGGTITQAGGIANFFGTTSNIKLVASAYYIIDIYLFYLNTTAGAVTWTLTNSAAPTAQSIYFEMSPATGVVTPPGSASSMLVGQFSGDATAARTVVTASLTSAVDHYAHFKIFLKNGTGTSLKIQATKATGGSITPRANSYWICRRISPNNIGAFAA